MINPDDCAHCRARAISDATRHFRNTKGECLADCCRWVQSTPTIPFPLIAGVRLAEALATFDLLTLEYEGPTMTQLQLIATEREN